MRITINLMIFTCFIVYSCKVKEQESQFSAFKTKKVDSVDNYFGTEVPDPYRWLEYDTAQDVKEWVNQQNELTFNYLDQIPFRDGIRKRLTNLYNYPSYSNAFQAGDYFFFYKNEGLQNQKVIYFQKGLDGNPEVFFDPNTLSEDGTVTASISGLSNDKKYVTLNIAKSGSDWQDIIILEISSKRVLSDTLNWVKFSGSAWLQDGFFYSRYDAPKKGHEFSAKNEFHKVYYHKLGESQQKDQLVYADKENPLRYYGADVTQDERFQIIYASQGTHGTEVYFRDLKKPNSNFSLLFKGFDYDYTVVDNVGDQLLVLTNDKAKNYRLVLVDPLNPARKNWKNILPEQKELLENVEVSGNKIMAVYMKDVLSKLYQYDLNGKLEKEVPLVDLGNISEISGEKDSNKLLYTFTSFLYPPTLFVYDTSTGESEVFKQSEAKINPADYETKQVFFTSKDGTKVPMFIVHKRGLKIDGDNPTYLYGYGGFNVSLKPTFSPSRFLLLENDGVYALANLRGGGEYGEQWHEAGMLLKKQNVFDDFIAASEYLIKEKYTSSDRLAIAGGSNGGLLVGAAMTQRPELYKVAFPAVGVMDMLRYHKFTVGWGWAVEYGSSDDPEHFKNLLSYSPLHNLQEGESYPATMVTTADHDDRVVPAHSFKFAATLQEKHAGENPVLIRIDTKAGHGAGKPISKIIDEQTDLWSFMFYNMNLNPKYSESEKIE